MNLLLDTCVVIWLTVKAQRLPQQVIAAIENADHVYVNPLCLVELAIKEKKRATPLMPFDTLFTFLATDEQFEFLPFDEGAGLMFRSLDWRHNDPFDRMLISQALAHDLTLVTPDTWAPAYGAKVLW